MGGEKWGVAGKSCELRRSRRRAGSRWCGGSGRGRFFGRRAAGRRTAASAVALGGSFVGIAAVIGDVKTGPFEDKTSTDAQFAFYRSGAGFIHALGQVRVLH